MAKPRYIFAFLVLASYPPAILLWAEILKDNFLKWGRIAIGA